jgi:N-acetylglucosaminyldiphosphoundecaprenol N-acetyl-beta-D-mannosaminyltransferase
VVDSARTSHVFGVRLDEIRSLEQLRAACEAFLDGDRPARIFTPNPEILLQARDDRPYARVLNSSDLALADGVGVALVQSIRARRRVHRWPGADIGGLLVRIAARREVTVAFLGGGDGVAELAADRWRRALPGVRIEVVGAGTAFDEEGRADGGGGDASLVRAVTATKAAVVLVALGAPKQERWIARNADAIPTARVLIGIGGTFDMWAGRLPRAPGAVRRFGLEWAWRLAHEPSRWRRIVRATIVFPYRALTDSRA